jgi:hypothetical protein
METFEISCPAEVKRIRLRQVAKNNAADDCCALFCFGVSGSVTGSGPVGLTRLSNPILAKIFDIWSRKFTIRFDTKEYDCPVFVATPVLTMICPQIPSLGRENRTRFLQPVFVDE